MKVNQGVPSVECGYETLNPKPTETQKVKRLGSRVMETQSLSRGPLVIFREEGGGRFHVC